MEITYNDTYEENEKDSSTGIKDNNTQANNTVKSDIQQALTDSIKTGDNNRLFLMLVILFVALAGVSVGVRRIIKKYIR